ncbi:MAG: hypothetical protein CMP07_05775 [Xanthomonadales bacterium]|nr:hypothetical protein [Xanthomonadales bacterium]
MKESERLAVVESEIRHRIRIGEYQSAMREVQALRARHGVTEQVFRLAGAVSICGGMQEVAQQCLGQVEQLDPKLARSVLRDWARSCAEARQFSRALALIRSALSAAPDDPDCLLEFANYSLMVGRAEDAESALSRVLQARPDDPLVHEQMSRLAFQTGDADSAREHALRALALRPDSLVALRTLGDLRTTAVDDELLDALARTEATDDQSKVHRGFALGGLFEARGDARRAFEHFSTANAAQARIAADRSLDADQRTLKEAAAGIEARLGQAAALEPNPASPIFVVGVSRSGTTLTEQILAAHDGLIAAGERPDLPDLAIRIGTSPELTSSPDKLRREMQKVADRYLDDERPGRLVDKQPVNFRLLSLIGRLFPGARVVRMHRDPRDVCISNFASPIRPEMGFATSIDTISDEIEDFVASCEHSRGPGHPAVLDLVYEDLVRSPEREIRRLLAFCDLPWQEDCLRFFDHRRPVHTISAVQVREPLHSRSIGRWRTFEPQLAPWLERLETLASRAAEARAS